jgi:peroxiredoxin
MALGVGDQAPDFALRNQHGETVRLTDVLAERAALLVFYPWAFSGVCSGELREVQERVAELATDDVQVLTISCDAMFALRAWADRDGFTFPILADFWPHGEVGRAYGVFNEEIGISERGSFLIDRAGTIRWSVVTGIPDARSVDDYVSAIEGLARG